MYCRHRLILYRVAGRSSGAVEHFLDVNRTLFSVAVLGQLVTGRAHPHGVAGNKVSFPEEMIVIEFPHSVCW